MTNTTPKTEKKENPLVSLLINVLINVIIPVVILTKFSDSEYLKSYQWFIIALLFPIGYFIYDLIVQKKTNGISILGFVSILLTGGIVLFKFPPEWIKWKEAAVPFIIAIAVLISTKTKYPLVKTFIYNDKLLDVNRIEDILVQNGNKPKFEKMLNLSSIFLACSFFVSTILNFVLAEILIKSPADSPELNAEIGTMQFLSYFVIALPCTIIMVVILWYVIRSITKYTNLDSEEIYAPHIREKSK